MLTIAQYDSLLRYQQHDVEKKTRKIQFFISFNLHLFRIFLIQKAIRKINNYVISGLLKSKGLLAEFEGRSAAFKNKDLTEIINSIDKIIRVYVLLKEATIDDSFKEFINKMPEIRDWEGMLDETIDNFYSILRILKKQNSKTTIETSPLAFESSECSLTSLQTVINDRRST